MSEVKIKRVKGSFDSELEKRTYLPYVITAKCPECGKAAKLDLTRDYLSYPVIGDNAVPMCHDTDDDDQHEWEIVVNLDIVLKVVE